MLNIYITSNNFDFKPFSNLFVKIVVASLTLVVSIILIYHFDFARNMLARVIGLGGVYLMAGIFVLLYYLRFNYFSNFKLNLYYVKFCISFTLPLILNYIINDALSLTDKLMLSNILNLDSVGIYALSLSFSTVCLVITTMFENTFTPFYYKFLDEDDNDGINIHTNYYIELYTIITCGFILLSKEVYNLYADMKYHDGASLIPIFSLSFYFLFLNLIPMHYQFYNKVSKASTFSSIISLILNIILNYQLITLYGIYGAAVASLISRLCNFIINHFFSYYRIGSKYKFNSLFYFKWLLMVLISIILFNVSSNNSVFRWSVGIFLGLFEVSRIIRRKAIF